MVELWQLRHFLAVAETLHFTRAAAILGISQQPLSRSIARLEEELGVRLFERTTRRVALTEAGEVLLREGNLVIQQLNLAERRTRDAGRVSLRVVYPGRFGPLPHAALAAYREVAPAIRVRASLTRTWEQEALIARGEADLGFIVPPAHSALLRTRRILRIPLVVALPADHPLCDAPRLRLADLCEERWVLYSKRHKRALADFIDGLCDAAGFRPRRGATANDEPEVLGQVGLGLGVALVGAPPAADPAVVLRPLREAPRIDLAVTWRRSDDRPELHALVDVFARMASELDPSVADRSLAP